MGAWKQTHMDALKAKARTKCFFVAGQLLQFCRNIFCLCAWWQGRRKKTTTTQSSFFLHPQTAGCVLARTPWRPKLNTTSLQMRQRGGARRFGPNRQPNAFAATLLLSPGASVSEESHLVSWQPRLCSGWSGSRGFRLNDRKKRKKYYWCTKVAEGGAPATPEKDFYPSNLWSRNDVKHQFENFIGAIGFILHI